MIKVAAGLGDPGLQADKPGPEVEQPAAGRFGGINGAVSGGSDVTLAAGVSSIRPNIEDWRSGRTGGIGEGGQTANDKDSCIHNGKSLPYRNLR